MHVLACLLAQQVGPSFAAIIALSRCLTFVCFLWQAGVHYIEGRATVVDEHTVSLNGKKYTVRLLQLIPSIARPADRAWRVMCYGAYMLQQQQQQQL